MADLYIFIIVAVGLIVVVNVVYRFFYGFIWQILEYLRRK